VGYQLYRLIDLLIREIRPCDKKIFLGYFSLLRRVFLFTLRGLLAYATFSYYVSSPYRKYKMADLNSFRFFEAIVLPLGCSLIYYVSGIILIFVG